MKKYLTCILIMLLAVNTTNAQNSNPAEVAFSIAKDYYQKDSTITALSTLLRIKEKGTTQIQGEKLDDWVEKCFKRLNEKFDIAGVYKKNRDTLRAIHIYKEICSLEHIKGLENRIKKNKELKQIIGLSYNALGAMYFVNYNYKRSLNYNMKSMEYGIDVSFSNAALAIRVGNLSNPTKYKMSELYEHGARLGLIAPMDSAAVEYEREGNLAKALEWVSKSAVKGSNFAKMKFAQYYIFNNDKLKFSTPAATVITYLKEAAEDKDKITSSGAKLCLGYVYLSGECGKEAVEYNEYEGKKLLREAANAGNQDARKLLNNL